MGASGYRHDRRRSVREARRRRHIADQRARARRRSRPWRAGLFPSLRGMPRREWTGSNGAGYQFPPLWGPDCFNNGAGMSRLLTAAVYAMHNMPIGTTFDAPVLSDENAYDVAAYIINQQRPQKANLDKDFPIRLQKPVDTPYGP